MVLAACSLSAVARVLEVKVTRWAYPDGGLEILAASVPPARTDTESREWSEALCIIPVDTLQGDLHAVMSRATPAVDGLGVVYAWAFPRGACPALVECDRIIVELASGRRAATRVRRLARANSLVYMSTLTVPDSGSVSRSALVRLWRGFLKTKAGVRLFHRIHGGWLCVPEPHKSNPEHYHLHVLHANRLNAVQVRAAWTAYVLSQGYTLPDGMRGCMTHESYMGSPRRAARYVAKYLSKGFAVSGGLREVEGTGLYGRERSTHRYLRSQGLADCSTVLYVPEWAVARSLFPSSAKLLQGETGFSEWVWAAIEPPERTRGAPSVIPYH